MQANIPKILRSYLVKLGVAVDLEAANNIKDGLGQVQKIIGEHTDKITKITGAGVAAAATFLGAIDIAILKTVKNVTKADLEYDLLSRRMFMGADAAKAFKIATDELGYSLSEIAWNEELRAQYFTLVDQINKLRLPPEAKEMFQGFRDLVFQFSRLRVAAKSAFEYIAYNLLSLNEGDLKRFSDRLKEIIQYVIENIPNWSVTIAEFLQVPLELTKTFFRLIGSLWDLFKEGGNVLKEVWDKVKELWDMLPDWAKKLAVIAGVLSVFTINSPLIIGIAAFVGFLTLVNDFFGWMEGKDSSHILAPLWTLADFIAFGLNSVIVTAIVLWDNLWKAIKGDWAGWANVKEDLFREWGFLEEAWKEQKEGRKAKRRKTLGLEEGEEDPIDRDDFAPFLPDLEDLGDALVGGTSNIVGSTIKKKAASLVKETLWEATPDFIKGLIEIGSFFKGMFTDSLTALNPYQVAFPGAYPYIPDDAGKDILDSYKSHFPGAAGSNVTEGDYYSISPTININTLAQDTGEISESVMKAMQESIDQARRRTNIKMRP